MRIPAADLIVAAHRARARAYAPYSGFSVGAALLTASGEIVEGTNVENAAYPLSICAERSALASAVAQGHRAFEAIAIVGERGVEITPCGGCRQVLAEFAPSMVVIRENRPHVTLRDLLPDPFGAETLRGAAPGEKASAS